MQLLIAHRDAAVRAALARAIAGDGSDLEIVESDAGEQALELLLDEHAPRLAVVDWDLPGLDGTELCRIVRDFHLGKPPYIVLLAPGRHPDVTQGLAAGANDCIRTPVGGPELRERVTAGRRLVEVPWEDAARGGSDVERGPEAPGAAGLQAVLTADNDYDPWITPEQDGDPWRVPAADFAAAGGSAPAGRTTPAAGPARLEAVLRPS